MKEGYKLVVIYQDGSIYETEFIGAYACEAYHHFNRLAKNNISVTCVIGFLADSKGAFNILDKFFR